MSGHGGCGGEGSGSVWHCGQYVLDMQQPKVMGIVNATPDSFSDGGRYYDAGAALRHCERLVDEGADMLDIGAESSRPGAQPMGLEEELTRLKPIVSEAARLGVPVSVDTYKPEVMQRVVEWGASVINDIWGFRQAGALEAMAQNGCGMVIMHMHREPQTMQTAPMQGDALRVVDDVRAFLQQRCDAAVALGIASQRLCVDTGFGFGKTTEQNFALLAQFPRAWAAAGFSDTGNAGNTFAGAFSGVSHEKQKKTLHERASAEISPQTGDCVIPVLMGCSRKSSLGAITGLDVEERLLPSVVAAVLSAEHGARVLRVHDVRETRQALAVWQAARGGSQTHKDTD